MIFSMLNSFNKLGEVFMCMYTSCRGIGYRSQSKSEFQMFSLFLAAMLVSLGGTPIWRLHTELFKICVESVFL